MGTYISPQSPEAGAGLPDHLGAPGPWGAAGAPAITPLFQLASGSLRHSRASWAPHLARPQGDGMPLASCTLVLVLRRENGCSVSGNHLHQVLQSDEKPIVSRQWALLVPAGCTGVGPPAATEGRAPPGPAPVPPAPSQMSRGKEWEPRWVVEVLMSQTSSGECGRQLRSCRRGVQLMRVPGNGAHQMAGCQCQVLGVKSWCCTPCHRVARGREEGPAATTLVLDG